MSVPESLKVAAALAAGALIGGAIMYKMNTAATSAAKEEPIESMAEKPRTKSERSRSDLADCLPRRMVQVRVPATSANLGPGSGARAARSAWHVARVACGAQR